MVRRALLFTDVVDSTRWAERLGDEKAAAIWSEHDRRARDLLAEHDGREIDRTDGFCLLFEHVDAAIAYALAYHQLLASLGLTARAGIHVGDVVLRPTPAQDVARGAKPLEVDGLAKPFAARVMSLAGSGQTLLSDAAREALAARPVEGVEVQRHGHYRLKGIEAPAEIFEVGRLGTVRFMPLPDVDKAYRVTRIGGLWRPAREVRHNLPAERDAFVGRGAELRTLAARLDDGARLLTVTGPGGAGKTRLVRRFAWSRLGEWPGGVCFCDLSESRSRDGIWFAVAAALDVPLGRDDPAVQLGHAIAARGRCLVILDNFEQVVEYASDTVGRWLDRAGDAAFIVTSRERLHLGGELLLPLEPLPVATDSVELFVTRAEAQRPGFECGAKERAAVAEIVRLLDGLPLAIELAAARVGVLAPTQLLVRLKDRFQLLARARGASTAARQATLRATIDWSWGLLTPAEQAVLAQCSVFEGGFNLAAAEAVIDLGASAPTQTILDVVEALVDKSLLRTWHPGLGRYDLDEPYFGMYLSIREYARERLHAGTTDGGAASERRHGTYFAGFGSDEAIEALSRHDGVARRRALALEVDNLVAACRRALARGDAATALGAYRAAWEVLELQGPATLAAALGRQLVALPGLAGRARAIALSTVGLPLHRAGQMNQAERCVEEALALAQDGDDRGLEGRILGQRGTLHLDQGRTEAARADLQAALAADREAGDRRAEGAVLGNLGNLCLEQGLMDEARRHYEAALQVNREIGNRRIEGSVLGNLGLLHYEQGRPEEARGHYLAALEIHREVGSRRLEGTVLGNLGLLCTEQGELEASLAHHEAALALHRAVGNRRDEGIVLANLGELQFARGALDEARECYDNALAIARETGYRRVEGGILGGLGELLAARGRTDEARASLASGEGILRAVGDRLGLGKLLCVRSRVESAAGSGAAAQAALAEAEAIAAAAGAGPESELGREITRLRRPG